MMSLAKILLGTDRKVTPLQLLQLLRTPFFRFFKMTPSLQSSESCFSSHITAKSGWRTCAVNSGFALKSSALRLYCPGAFPCLRNLMAVMISSFSGGVVLTSILYFCFNCWWWSVHLASCSAAVVSSLPCLSTIGVLKLFKWVTNCTIVLNDEYCAQHSLPTWLASNNN